MPPMRIGIRSYHAAMLLVAASALVALAPAQELQPPRQTEGVAPPELTQVKDRGSRPKEASAILDSKDALSTTDHFLK
jgi:hypothetical protein